MGLGKKWAYTGGLVALLVLLALLTVVAAACSGTEKTTTSYVPKPLAPAANSSNSANSAYPSSTTTAPAAASEHPFPRTGAHANLACPDCHVSKPGAEIIPGTELPRPDPACVSCHGDKHGGLTDCASCHTPTVWTDVTFRAPLPADRWACRSDLCRLPREQAGRGHRPRHSVPSGRPRLRILPRRSARRVDQLRILPQHQRLEALDLPASVPADRRACRSCLLRLPRQDVCQGQHRLRFLPRGQARGADQVCILPYHQSLEALDVQASVPADRRACQPRLLRLPRQDVFQGRYHLCFLPRGQARGADQVCILPYHQSLEALDVPSPGGRGAQLR